MSQPQQHILVVDDDPEIADLVGRLIAAEGFRVSRAPDARAGRRVMEGGTVDLLVLDLMLPGKDGLTFCRELRAEGVETPIIMLTAKGDDFDRVLGLEMGADDYLPKPFHSRELLARIKAVLRRSDAPGKRPSETTPRFLSFAGWRLDTGKRELVSADGVVVLLSSAEYELLMAFVTWPQMVLSREKLLDATKGRSAIISDRSIDIQVSRLRRKLGDDPRTPRIIKTVWGDGYLFTPDVS
ncbi:response regulator [Rubellimicrobium roseum]|uniref:Regulatory protein VirG n=1 Tax=Rubellimicrobium roseum TaxID=687525 RepID=A0A5C4N9G7_9RHOB|nr:response regulator [Rubellimicrobium roseum]TNC63119.1 response regulator [Rubellimicrobium roseum]